MNKSNIILDIATSKAFLAKLIVKSSYPKVKKFRKMKVFKSVNLHPEYVPRCFRNEMQKKKQSINSLQKKLQTFKQAHSE